MERRVIVVGAGMAGLNLALALGRRRNHRVVLLERDPAPEAGAPLSAFWSWKRPGVAHLRQSHIFHPRILALYRRRHPALLEALLRAGARELPPEEALPSRLLGHYVAAPGDVSCTLLLSRRATLEAVLRDHVARLPGVEIVSSASARGVVLEGARITAVQIARGETRGEIQGDVIVDASGRFTRFPRWLAEKGVHAREEANVEVRSVYYTRYYRLREGRSEPAERGRPVFGRRAYLSCCVYPADARCFSITLTCDEGDRALRERLADRERFHLACTSLAEIAPWVEPGRAEPVTDVLAMARFRNYWRSYVAAGQPLLSGFFAIGDALAHTNPAYGAGCSWAAEHAHILADVLASTDDPLQQALSFDRQVREQAYPYYCRMAAGDQAAVKGEAAPSAPPGWRNRLRAIARSAAERARQGDAGIFLWALRRKYMIGTSQPWPDRLFLLRRLLLFGLRGRWYRGARGRRHALSRDELLRLLSAASSRDRGLPAG